MSDTQIAVEGLLVIEAEVEYPDRVIIEGDEHVKWERDGNRFRIERHNAFVNTGLQVLLDRLFGIGGPPAAIGWIGVDNDNTAVTASTTYLHGAAGATAANQIIKAISPAASRSGQTTTAGASFANADFTSGVFIINKVGLLNTATDAGTGLIDVIGGSGGTSPYNKTFSVNFTAAGSFTLTPQIAVTAQAA